MKVTCPKCQFENHADSSRVVCARCATIIEVRMDQGFDSNGKRQTARLPFASGDLSSGGQSLSGQRLGQSDVYATRIGDDFDDVLDVPIQPQSGYQGVDDAQSAQVFEDVYAAQSQDQSSPYDFVPYDKPSASPVDTFRPAGSRQRETPGYDEPADQEFVGWPVLPEGAEEEEDEAARSGRGGLYLKIGLGVALVGVVGFWTYYFLGERIIDRFRKQDRPSVQQTADSEASNPVSSQTPESHASSEAQTSSSPSGEPESSGSASLQTAKPKDGDENPIGGVSQPPSQNGRSKEREAAILTPLPKLESGARSNGISNSSMAAPPSDSGALRRSRLTIQVGSFKDQGEADARASSLNATLGGEFHVVRAEIPGRGVWYRVQQVSGFTSREAAISYGNQLRARNLITDFIVTMR